ncbi:Tuberous sclerosis 2-like protein [Gonapodya sp. JEL0774]|nr:Tuberous sclerosis 2-like protein [Gonapodya sp. JEL0774]
MEFWRSLAGQKTGAGRGGSSSVTGKSDGAALQKASPEQLAIQLQHILSQLRSANSNDTKVAVVEELSKFAHFYDVSHELDEVWDVIKDFTGDSDERTRRCGWRFIAAVAEGNYEQLGFRRAMFLRALSHPSNRGKDFQMQLELLILLTRDGTDSDGVELEISEVVRGWCTQLSGQLAALRTSKGVKGGAQVLMARGMRPIGSGSDVASSSQSSSSSRSLEPSVRQPAIHPRTIGAESMTPLSFKEFSVLISLVGRTLHNKTPGITGIVEASLLVDVARILSLSTDPRIRENLAPADILAIDNLGEESLHALEGAWLHCRSFSMVLKPLTTAYSCAVGSPVLFNRAWSTVRSLLLSRYGQSVSQTLCDLIDQPEGQEAQIAARGAVFCLGMASWGAQRVLELTVSRYHILVCFLEAAKLQWDHVDYEILLSLHYLVVNSLTELLLAEWHAIIEILLRLKRHHSPPFTEVLLEEETSYVPNEVNTLATTASQVYSSILTIIWRHQHHPSESFPGMSEELMDLQLALCGIEMPRISPTDFYQSSATYVALHPDVNAKVPKSLYNDVNSRKALSPSLILEILNNLELSQRLSPTNSAWLHLLSAMGQSFFVHETRTLVRKGFLDIVMTLYWVLRDKDRLAVLQTVLFPFVYERLASERDHEVIVILMRFAGGVIWHETPPVYSGSDRLAALLFECATVEDAAAAPECAKIAVRLFSGCLRGSYSSKWAPIAFKALVGIADPKNGKNKESRLWALKSLLAIRADADWRLWQAEGVYKEQVNHAAPSTVHPPAIFMDVEDEAMRDVTYIPSIVCFMTRDENLEETTPVQQSGSMTQSATKEVADDASSISDDSVVGDITFATESDIVISMDPMVDLMVEIIKTEHDYDVFSLVLDGLSQQLSYMPLFENSRTCLQKLRVILCDSILNDQLAPNLKLPKNMRKADLYVRAYRILVAVLPYAKQCFSKSDQDEIVLAFQLGLTKWTQTAGPCTHALLLCMYELPLSMVKHLVGTLGQMQRKLSTTAISVHFLEFLVSLIKKPILWANFVEADYQRVFAIALQYIQHAASTSASSASPSGMFAPKSDQASQQPAKESSQTAQSHFSPVAQNALSQYVIFLAYHTITLWFSSLRLSDRRRFVPYVLRNLALANGTTRPIDERIEVCVDMLMRFSYSNVDPKPQKSLVNKVIFDNALAGQVLARTWLQGNAFVTIKVLKSSGWAEISVRRPTGTTVFLSRLENRMRGDDIDIVSLAATLMTGIGVTQPAQTDFVEDSPPNSPMLRHGRTGSEGALKTAGDLIEISQGSDSLRRARTDPSRPPQTLLNTRKGGKNFAGNSSEPAALHKDVESEGIDRTSARPSSWANIRAALVSDPLVKTSLEGGNGYAGTRKEDSQLFEPAFVFSSLSVFPDYSQRDEQVRLLPDDNVTSRALSVMDRTPLVDFIKVGVVYVAPGQSTEGDILRNSSGSIAYLEFIKSIGKFFRLKGCTDIYTGGLDTEMDMDGAEALFYDEGRGQFIFHCTTLMPNHEHDVNCTAKKRHIGNDYVLIVWNEGGRPFEFRTIPGQFNFINIIIEPVDSRFGLATEQTRRSPENTYYRVSTQRREDMPEFGPVSDPKLVSALSLPGFVRHLASTADVFSQLFYKQTTGTTLEEWVSNWRERLRAIKRVREQPQAQTQSGHTTPPARQISATTLPSPTLTNSGLSAAIGGGTRMYPTSVAHTEQLDVILDFTRNT